MLRFIGIYLKYQISNWITRPNLSLSLLLHLSYHSQYRVGQLYMIARHSLEQSVDGEGVEVVESKAIEDPVHGKGHLTEKRIHLSR